MSTFIWCELICVACNKHLAGEFTAGAVPRRKLMKEARKIGAVFEGRDAFCSERHKAAFVELMKTRRQTG